jgi:ubiquinone/menaquinone biosynthesis C-methylase UbiE
MSALDRLGSWWNGLRYTLYIPVYDAVASVFTKHRKVSIAQYHWKGNERVLIVGAGSGLDFKHLPTVNHVDAVDISPGMLALMKLRATNKPYIHPRLMDGHQLDFEDARYDVVILHLILAVIPNPVRALKEAERVLKPGGTILVFDKFKPSGKKTSLIRFLINIPSIILATSVNRALEPLVASTKLKLVSSTPAAFGGLFRYALIEKKT